MGYLTGFYQSRIYRSSRRTLHLKKCECRPTPALPLSFCVNPQQVGPLGLEYMKPIITLLFSCALTWAAETDLRVVSTSGTNADSTVVWTKDVFMRDGQTNLVRTTKVTPYGGMQVARFYHAGHLVGNFVSFPLKESQFNSEAGLYCMSLQYGPAGEIRSAKIGDQQGMLLDEFIFTNGNFCPIKGPLRQNGLMKTKFGDGSKSIKETAESEARSKKQTGGKDAPTNQ